MADALISVVVEQLAPFLLDKLKKEVKLVLGAPEDVQELHDTFDKIRDVLDDAEKRHVKNVLLNLEKNEIKKVPESAWLEKLKDVSYEMEDVLDEWHTKILKSEIAANESSAPDGARVSKKKDKGLIPVSIWNLKSLRTLLVCGMDYCEDLSLLSDLTSLRALDLSGTKIKELPKEIEKLIHLRYLSSTGVEELPETVGNLSNLQTLKLNGCYKLRRLPDEIGKLVSLSHLEARGTALKELAETVGNLSNLQTLILNRCGELRKLPETVGNLSNLQTLKLNGCYKLRRLPDEIGKLVSLSHLEARGTALKELAETVGNLSNLQTLILNRCGELRKLPETVGNLSNLQTLELNGCQELCRLPNDMGKMVSLRHFEAEHRGLEELPETVFRKTKNIENLDPGDDDEAVQSLLELLEPHPNLEELVIEKYSGSKFPSWMEFPKNWEGRSIMLRQLRIKECKKLKVLPALGRLEFLEDLNLSGLHSVSQMGIEVLGVLKNGDSSAAPVIAFPNLKKLEIWNMIHWEELVIKTTVNITLMPLLQELRIRYCPLLKSLPCQILSSSLREMIISSCPYLEVSYLPPFMEELTLQRDAGPLLISLPIQNGLHSNLKSLTIWNSPHSTLPQGLSQLKALQTLKIRDCESLTCMSDELQHLTSLQILNIYKCPILGPRCKKEVGEDWSIISHIPNIQID
ncbi:hypothetical protein GIB67_043105 [Kingdonia uniflora]|uniref:Uncharacterized protein n=1 Tax=Kingdonia uniflora TaxID=39325 RepID=A0A7J7MH18_9MAGN|nr:hypothetical protein GIB67_043105 [Kingdonia uniflora]